MRLWPFRRSTERHPALPVPVPVVAIDVAPEQLLTAPGGPISLDQEARSKVAIFGDGRALVSAGHASQPAVEAAILQARLMLKREHMSLEYVDPGQIEAAYAAAAGVRASSLENERRLEQMLEEAFQCGVTDIWMRPAGSAVEVLWRINGEQTPPIDLPLKAEARELNACLYNACMKKTTGGYNELASQDGRLARDQSRIKLPAGMESVRIHWSPTGNGHDTSMRLQSVEPLKDLDTQGFAALGYEPEHLRLLQLMLEDNDGGVLVGGPVGSGKTTFTKAFLETFLAERGFTKKALGLADPPEMDIRGVSTLLVSSDMSAGAREEDYERAGRDLLRQDPDVTMLQEIRDRITTTIFFQMITSGRPSIATVHAKSALDILDRLLDWAAPQKQLFKPGIVRGLIYQRLVPGLCPHCCEPMDIAMARLFKSGTQEDLARADRYARVSQLLVESIRYWGMDSLADLSATRVRGEGCAACRPPAALQRRLDQVAKRMRINLAPFEGSRGVSRRLPVLEIVRPDRKLLDLIREGPAAPQRPEIYWREELNGMPVDVHLLRRVLRAEVDPLDAHRTRNLGLSDLDERRLAAVARTPATRRTRETRPVTVKPAPRLNSE